MKIWWTGQVARIEKKSLFHKIIANFQKTGMQSSIRGRKRTCKQKDNIKIGL